TPTPARENSPATSDIAALSERAPWEPPTTRTVGASGSRPNSARARARRSARSSEDTVRLTGLPTTRASSPEPWTAARVATANRSPSLLASPERARSEEHTYELQSRFELVIRILVEYNY